MGKSYTIASCTADQRAEALRVLHAGLPTDQQMGLVHALQVVQDQGPSAFVGLFVATDGGAIVAATWAQLNAGQTAVVWLPDQSSPAALGLMEALAGFLEANQITLAQLLVGASGTVSAELLEAGEFQMLAKLAYLAADCCFFPTEQPTTQLQFAADAGADPHRLGELLLRTYEDSQDCPQLNGVRNTEDTLEGYREQGEFAPQRWFLVQHADQDVGALILTSHPDTGNWELVYMGLVPEARGNGFGQQILEFALWQAGLGGAERLVLAVDEANQYALEMYERAGFVAWDYRTVYARLRP